MNKVDNRKNIISALLLVLMLFLVAGISYAAYTYANTGDENTITTGEITMSYAEPSNALEIHDALPVSDTAGKAMGNYFEFTVTSHATTNANDNIGVTLVYEVNIETLDNSYYCSTDETKTTQVDCGAGWIQKEQLSASEVKVYLEEVGNAEEITEPKKLNELSTSTRRGTALKVYETSNTFKNGAASKSETYRLRMFIAEDAVATNFSGDEEYRIRVNINGDSGVVNVAPPTTYSLVSKEAEVANVQAPELETEMVPVYYESTTSSWRIADKDNTEANYKWYNYGNKEWANMVLVKETGVNSRAYYTNQANVGEAVNMDDILAMYVWIPRFSAVTPSTPTDVNNPPAINVTFVDTNSAAHDAFTFDENISGFWYGKFETSSDTTCTAASNSALGEGCNLDTIMPRVIPNVTSWRGAQLATYFTVYRNMETTGNEYGLVGNEIDTHISKNNEWGAVAYLTHSIYGRCSNATTCTEIGINNNSSYITGYGAPAGSDISVRKGTYETTLGMNASTTGNIYGIYDMSGGAWEYVMGNYNRVVGLTSSSYTSGFTGTNGNGTTLTGYPFPEDKYINIYTTEVAYTTAGYQHAMVETSGWYGNFATFVTQSYAWSVRGGYYSSKDNGGIFTYAGMFGFCMGNSSSRAVITP